MALAVAAASCTISPFIWPAALPAGAATAVVGFFACHKRWLQKKSMLAIDLASTIVGALAALSVLPRILSLPNSFHL